MLPFKRSFLTKLILCYIDSTPRHSFHIFTYSTSSANLMKFNKMANDFVTDHKVICIIG